MTERSRKELEEMCASALRALFGLPYEHAKEITATQVISLCHYDHDPIRKTDGGPFVHWNLVPRLIAEHRKKTATFDVPQIAKRTRIQDSALIHDATLARKDGDHVAADLFLERVTRRSRLRPKATIRSQGFDKTRTKTFGGKVVPRRRRS